VSKAHSINAQRLDGGCFRPGPAVEIPGAASGQLAGLPFVAKDLFDVAGVVTGGVYDAMK
jgi:hypothetical protein